MKTLTTYFRRKDKIKASLTLSEYASGRISVTLFDSEKKEFIYDETFENNEYDVAQKLYSVSQKQLIPFFDRVEEITQTEIKLK